MISLAKPVTVARCTANAQRINGMQVFSALRKQTIKARPTICASFYRYRKSGYCYINCNGITKRVSTDYFFHVQSVADKRYSFWNDQEKSGCCATIRKCFIIGFGVES